MMTVVMMVVAGVTRGYKGVDGVPHLRHGCICTMDGGFVHQHHAATKWLMQFFLLRAHISIDLISILVWNCMIIVDTQAVSKSVTTPSRHNP